VEHLRGDRRAAGRAQEARRRARGQRRALGRALGIELRHFAVLLVLVNRGPTEQRDLVEATESDKAGIMRIVDDLERKGLAVRKSVPGDRRVRAVEITPKGLDLFDAAHVAAGPLAERLISVMGPGEAEQLKDLLTRFTSSAQE